MKKMISVCTMLLTIWALAACGGNAGPAATAAEPAKPMYVDTIVHVDGVETSFPIPIGELLGLLPAKGVVFTTRGSDEEQCLTLKELEAVVVTADTCGELWVHTEQGRTIEVHWYAPYTESRPLLECLAMKTVEHYNPFHQEAGFLRVLGGDIQVGMHRIEVREILAEMQLPFSDAASHVFLSHEENPRKQNDQVALYFDEEGILHNIAISAFHQP